MIEKLIRFVQEHDGCEAVEGPNGTLMVTGGVIDRDGVYRRESEIIPATLKACRDWLGY